MATLQKTVYISKCFDPFENLGFEDYLMSICQQDEVILYLWQNQKTIVIGKHQHPYKECNLTKLQKDGIHLVRRRTGGGAVFHDHGNLNFTFIAHPMNYDQKKHFQVILEGLKPWGIEATQTGRNDITVDQKKFSGNAFLYKKNINCHHGTLLVDANLQELGRYLTPSTIKLVSKGIESVRSRVVNLKELNQSLTIDGLRKTLTEAFDQCYSGDLNHKTIPTKKVYESFCKHYIDWQWTIGKSPQATMSHGETFEWGNLVIDLVVRDGVIDSCIVSSDTLLDQPIEKLQNRLKGIKLKRAEIEAAMEGLLSDKSMTNDLKTFMRAFV